MCSDAASGGGGGDAASGGGREEEMGQRVARRPEEPGRPGSTGAGRRRGPFPPMDLGPSSRPPSQTAWRGGGGVGSGGAWPVADPREAWARLERLRKGYARDVRELRPHYAYEVQLVEAERQRKAEVRRGCPPRQRGVQGCHAAATMTRAFEQDFRQALHD